MAGDEKRNRVAVASLAYCAAGARIADVPGDVPVAARLSRLNAADRVEHLPGKISQLQIQPWHHKGSSLQTMLNGFLCVEDSCFHFVLLAQLKTQKTPAQSASQNIRILSWQEQGQQPFL